LDTFVLICNNISITYMFSDKTVWNTEHIWCL